MSCVNLESAIRLGLDSVYIEFKNHRFPIPDSMFLKRMVFYHIGCLIHCASAGEFFETHVPGNKNNIKLHLNELCSVMLRFSECAKEL
jgi:hypothetical protein